MKRAFSYLLLVLALLLPAITASAQKAGEVLSKNDIPLTWLGLDFSHVRYVGDPGTVSPEEMKSLFKKINELMLQEPDKYDFAKAFNRSAPIVYKIEATEGRNDKVDAGKLISPNPNDAAHLDAEQVKRMVQQYPRPAGATDVGLVYVVESLDKTHEEANYWVTLVDLKTKSVLFTTRVSSKAAGFGFRNHWAGAIYSGLKEIRSSLYGKWKKQLAK